MAAKESDFFVEKKLKSKGDWLFRGCRNSPFGLFEPGPILELGQKPIKI